MAEQGILAREQGILSARIAGIEMSALCQYFYPCNNPMLDMKKPMNSAELACRRNEALGKHYQRGKNRHRAMMLIPLPAALY
ncbi:MAG: hypothetical protein WB499_14015 [Pseudolabrys sp.]